MDKTIELVVDEEEFKYFCEGARMEGLSVNDSINRLMRTHTLALFHERIMSNTFNKDHLKESSYEAFDNTDKSHNSPDIKGKLHDDADTKSGHRKNSGIKGKLQESASAEDGYQAESHIGDMPNEPLGVNYKLLEASDTKTSSHKPSRYTRSKLSTEEKIEKWSKSKNQISHKLIRAFFIASDDRGVATKKDMKKLCEDKRRPDVFVHNFPGALCSMKSEGPGRRGVFFREDDSGNIQLDDSVKLAAEKYRQVFLS